MEDRLMRDPIEQVMFETGKPRLEVLEIMRDKLLHAASDDDPRKASALFKLSAAIAAEKQSAEKFRADVTKVLRDSYTLECGTEVRGQSMTYLRQCLRDEGWRGLQPWRLEDKLKAAGFKVSRGRGLRIYHGGVRKLGVTCDVVHAKE
jgi:hypothetical protein